MVRAVAWDIDGTLVDSEALHHVALMTVSAHYGVPIADDDTRFVGVSMDDVWSVLRPLYPPEVDEPTWQAAIATRYRRGAASLQAFPGALTAMAALQRAGIAQCCVSNSARAIVDINLAAIGAAPYLAFAISRDDVDRGKPDPAPYREACRRLALAPDQVLVVEDSATGVASAQAAGCPVVHRQAGSQGYQGVLDHVFAKGGQG